MATYKFSQFNVEIVNPTITIDLNTIGDKALDQLLAVNVLLTTDTASFGVRAEDLPYIGTWEDSDVQGMVNTWLTQFEVTINE
jgi:hypothetical protein